MGDLRTKRTYKLLQDALFKLLEKKSFDEIKVNDICELAMIHRTTFYTHFSDKYELLDYVISEVEKEITNDLNFSVYNSLEEFYTNMVMNVLNYIDNNKKFFYSLLNKNEDINLFRIFYHTCISYIKEMIEKEERNGVKHTVPVDLICEFYTGAVVSTIDWWLKTKSKLSKEELCNYITKLIFEKTHTEINM